GESCPRSVDRCHIPVAAHRPEADSASSASRAVAAPVAPAARLDRADSLPSLSRTFSAKKYWVPGSSPATVNDSAAPAACGAGSPAAGVAAAQLASVIGVDE